jgi:hypothetical protein
MLLLLQLFEQLLNLSSHHHAVPHKKWDSISGFDSQAGETFASPLTEIVIQDNISEFVATL